MGIRSLIALAAVALLLFSGCGKKRSRIPAPPAPPAAATFAMEEEGIASWYGHPYHGRAAANGEIYDMEKMTAAHRTLPFGTQVRVVNRNNKLSVEVRITDRGPFIDGRIIDLSRAAARAIEMIGPGTAPVHLQVLSSPAQLSGADAYYAVQTGAFRVRANADRQRKEMEQRYGSARIVEREGAANVWRVLVGRESTLEGANALAAKLRAATGHVFVVRMDNLPAN